jgi:hypothetical protein
MSPVVDAGGGAEEAAVGASAPGAALAIALAVDVTGALGAEAAVAVTLAVVAVVELVVALARGWTCAAAALPDRRQWRPK